MENTEIRANVNTDRVATVLVRIQSQQHQCVPPWCEYRNVERRRKSGDSEGCARADSRRNALL